MTTLKHHLLGAWSVYPAILLFGAGLVVCAGFMPPHAPSADAAEIAAIYRANSSMILIGMILIMIGGVLFVPFFAAIGWQMARIEGARPILATAQMMIGTITAALIILPVMLFAVAAFRPERSPELILLMNDLGWLILLWAFAPAFLQELAIGFCILSDQNPEPLLPRWLGYFNIWIAILFLPGALIPLFKTGPFAWNGLLAFYVPITAFFVWVLLMAVLLARAIRRPDPLTRTVGIETGGERPVLSTKAGQGAA